MNRAVRATRFAVICYAAAALVALGLAAGWAYAGASL